jgi:hypothetical protein
MTATAASNAASPAFRSISAIGSTPGAPSAAGSIATTS